MLKQKIIIFLCLFFVCSSRLSFSQILASQTTGCAPAQITFTAPAGSVSGTWNFGNGSSPFLVASNVFNTAGIFNVTFTSSSGVVSSIQIIISASNLSPSFTFTLPATHCVGMCVNFNCTGVSANISYQWSFGDGGLGNGSNPNYCFSLPGVFNPTVIVTNTVSGCTGTFSAGPINVSSLPNIIVSATPGLNSCVAPFTTSFTGVYCTSGSPLGGGLTYSWNFGNSQNSTLATPGNITYNTPGYYNAVVTVTDNNNCANTATQVVAVVQPSLLATVPASVCILDQRPATPVTFPASIQASQPSTVWNLGNGNTMTVNVPSANYSPSSAYGFLIPYYTTPGLKTLTITAATGSCIATKTANIFVEQITPQFTFTSPSYTCSPTFVATYSNQSTINSGNALSYSWTVNHWNNQLSSAYSSNAISPTFTLIEGSPNPYAYYGMYIATAVLEISSVPLGCKSGTVHVSDTMWRPTAMFNKDKRQGCAPLVVRFRDTSDVSPRFPVLSYTWNNGGTPAVIVSGPVPPAIQQPTFTYSTAGTYTPFLTITTAGGCSAVSFIDTIIVVNPPTVSVTFTPNLSVCAGVPVQIHMSAAPNSSLISHWHAETDDGFFSGCINDSMPVWPFTHLGTHTLSVMGSEHGCASSLNTIQTITVTGPVAKGRYQTNCTNKKSVDFYSYLDQVQTAKLDFGDNTYKTITGNPAGSASDLATHVYSASGNYTAILTGSNSTTGCSPYTFTMLVTVREINASFTITPTICKGATLTPDASGSTDVYVTCQRGYTWIVDTMYPRQTSAPFDTASFSTTGTHSITLIVKDLNGCRDSSTKTFIVDSPLPDFAFVSPACVSDMPLTFTNTSSGPLVSNTSFTWNFGTTGSNSLLVTNFATLSPTYNYNPAPPGATYTVSLRAKSSTGCLDSISHVLVVSNPPDAYLYPYRPNTCVNLSELFNTPVGYTNTVVFGDGSMPVTGVATGTIAHTYTAAGTYSPVLTLNYNGCSSTFTSNVLVQNYPIANFSFVITPTLTTPTGSVLCAPKTLLFTNTSFGTDSLNYHWDLGIGPIINSYTVSRGFYSPGDFPMSLIVSTFPSGCTDTIVQHIIVLKPVATATLSKTRFCLGDTIKLSMKDTTEIANWQWFFGNGLHSDTLFANGTPAPAPGFIYPYQYYPSLSNGSTTITLFANSKGNYCSTSSGVGIQVVKVDADFKRNFELNPVDSVHCLNIADTFSNTSLLNNSNVISSLNISWSFGNGVTSTTQSPVYTYPDPGVYTVSLTITDPQAGCRDVAVKNMTINALPTVTVSVIDSVCRGSNFVLSSSGTPDIASYQWSPVSGLASPNQASTNATASVSTTYSLVVTSIYGCKNLPSPTNSGYIYVQQPPPTIRWDTTIIIGQVATLNSNLGVNYTYTWSPLTNLSCSSCPYPTSTSTTNITYSVEVKDPMGCFRVINTYSVSVDPITTIDVPTAFTPNGDGTNDVIYVDGWGIKKLNYFRIFNRWGQLLFESTDIKVGWDGYFRGVPQNMETYIYQVSAEGYINGSKPFEKTSSFRLIR